MMKMMMMMIMMTANFQRFSVLNPSVMLSLNKSIPSVLRQLLLNFISQKTYICSSLYMKLRCCPTCCP